MFFCLDLVLFPERGRYDTAGRGGRGVDGGLQEEEEKEKEGNVG